MLDNLHFELSTHTRRGDNFLSILKLSLLCTNIPPFRYWQPYIYRNQAYMILFFIPNFADSEAQELGSISVKATVIT